MDVQIVRLRRFDDSDSKLKAFVDVSVGEFIVKGLRILQGREGLFLQMPCEQGKDGRWYSCFYPKTSEAYQSLSRIVLEAYNKKSRSD